MKYTEPPLKSQDHIGLLEERGLIIEDEIRARKYLENVGYLTMIERLLKKINPENSFVDKVITLVDEYPTVNTSSMGFPNNWHEEPAWKDVD